MGDFNARTANCTDILDAHLDPISFTDSQCSENDNIPSRTNRDTKINSKGKPFIEMLETNDLVILNGRTLGDIFGEFTCYKHNGCSAVDYICVSPLIYHKVSKFEVKNLSHISDHCPISTTINIGLHSKLLSDPQSFKFEDAPMGYKWSKTDTDNSVKKFTEAQKNPVIQSMINTLHTKSVENKEDVEFMNSELIRLYQKIASLSLKRKKNRVMKNKNKWYDYDCKLAKKKLCKATRKYNKYPFNEEIRKNFYTKKREHSNIIKKKKEKFECDANTKIESGSNLDWHSFKRLKSLNDEETEFDQFDLHNFFSFFKDLYKKKCQRSEHGTSDDVHQDHDCVQILNEPFTLEEVNNIIDKLSCNKSVSLDLIANEMLKSSCFDLKQLITTLFNHCLNHGIYPWNNSVTIPIHKNGEVQNPDNHRAITLGSCLGKLFSSALLERLIKFRTICCPDPPNQLGFCRGSQTSDHILTFKTIIDKYVTHGKNRLYACFVDYKKAFDRVCREALMYKLSGLGIKGPFFQCIKSMYSNSTTRIKLIKKISAAIDIQIGTEQGHPMSPELFKIFISDLSNELDKNNSATNVPDLDGTRVSHLLWADDLVLLAKDPKSLQSLIEILGDYINKWELEANMEKTNVMVFNTSGRLLKESHNFVLNEVNITSVRNYCYLGIKFSLNGRFKEAIKILTKKAQRGIGQLKRSIKRNILSVKSLFNLFDALIKPIAGYANQVWLPDTNLCKELIKSIANAPKQKGLLTMANRDPLEVMHLKFMKWCMGAHKKTSNVASYGDTGRMPLVLSLIDQSLKYFNRVSKLSISDNNSLVGKAFVEQKNLHLQWFQTWEALEEAKLNHYNNAGQPSCLQYSLQHEMFINAWNVGVTLQKKR